MGKVAKSPQASLKKERNKNKQNKKQTNKQGKTKEEKNITQLKRGTAQELSSRRVVLVSIHNSARTSFLVHTYVHENLGTKKVSNHSAAHIDGRTWPIVGAVTV